MGETESKTRREGGPVQQKYPHPEKQQTHARDIEIAPLAAQEEAPGSTPTRSPASRTPESGLSGDLAGLSLPHFLAVRGRHS